MSIHRLPTEISSRIAAGEVVERPASVIKELIENSLDAGAGSISITCIGAGSRLIEVADDGAGIESQDLSLAVERHATSKISNVDDLFGVKTLGFRGEALASISSVSRFSLTSRTNSMQAALRLETEGGLDVRISKVGAPPGTVVRVEDLFYNVPARKKFLKHDQTERSQIDALVARYALVAAMTRLSLIQENRPVIQTSGNGERREVLATVFGVDIARQMLEVLFEDAGIQINGFISPPSLTKSNRKEIYFFVNERPVQQSQLSAAVLQAYHTLLMVGRFPISVLFLTLDPAQVDVNVHPTKAEVRFANPGWVFANTQRAVRRALLAYSPVPEFNQPIHWPGFSAPPTAFPNRGDQLNVPLDRQSTIGPSDQTAAGDVDQQEEIVRTPILRLVGQVAATYLIAEGPDGLYLIDQHAAHERVLFEKFIKQDQTQVSRQEILQPVTVNVSSAQSRILDGQMEIIEKLGFRVEAFGPATYQIRAIPAMFSGMDPADAIRVLVEDFEEDEAPLQTEIHQRIVARICKRAAVKAGQILSPEEQKQLLTDLENCDSPRTCPHGRPTMIHLSVDLLERQFGRRGAL